jgi:hypothetical protein
LHRRTCRAKQPKHSNACPYQLIVVLARASRLIIQKELAAFVLLLGRVGEVAAALLVPAVRVVHNSSRAAESKFSEFFTDADEICFNALTPYSSSHLEGKVAKPARQKSNSRVFSKMWAKRRFSKLISLLKCSGEKNFPIKIIER